MRGFKTEFTNFTPNLLSLERRITNLILSFDHGSEKGPRLLPVGQHIRETHGLDQLFQLLSVFYVSKKNVHCAAAAVFLQDLKLVVESVSEYGVQMLLGMDELVPRGVKGLDLIGIAIAQIQGIFEVVQVQVPVEGIELEGGVIVQFVLQ